MFSSICFIGKRINNSRRAQSARMPGDFKEKRRQLITTLKAFEEMMHRLGVSARPLLKHRYVPRVSDFTISADVAWRPTWGGIHKLDVSASSGSLDS